MIPHAVTISIEIAAKTRIGTRSTGRSVRHKVHQYFVDADPTDEDADLIPHDYQFSAQAVNYDSLKPCYWQVLRINVTQTLYENMGVIKGQNLRLLIGGKCVAFSTSCTVHASLNLEESSTKDSTNNFTEQTPTGISWDMSATLYSVGHRCYWREWHQRTRHGACTAASSRSVRADTRRKEPRGSSAAVLSIQVMPWVNDISINAANRQNTSYTIQLDRRRSTGQDHSWKFVRLTGTARTLWLLFVIAAGGVF